MEPGSVIPDFWELERKPRLLVVEDDNDVGNLLKICFTNLGMDVTVTVMGREGLALFSTQSCVSSVVPATRRCLFTF
jgi:CheY-like chemotaxis protein